MDGRPVYIAAAHHLFIGSKVKFVKLDFSFNCILLVYLLRHICCSSTIQAVQIKEQTTPRTTM